MVGEHELQDVFLVGHHTFVHGRVAIVVPGVDPGVSNRFILLFTSSQLADVGPLVYVFSSVVLTCLKKLKKSLDSARPRRHISVCKNNNTSR